MSRQARDTIRQQYPTANAPDSVAALRYPDLAVDWRT